MEFSGFINSDFDFFRKKYTMDKTNLEEKKEDVKRHFLGFCYQIQKAYHSSTGKTIVFEKDFQGLGKSKNYISAKCGLDSIDFFRVDIVLCQDSINLNMVCPPDGDAMKYQELKTKLMDDSEILARFFKGNKNMYFILFKRNCKKSGEDVWEEEYKFNSNEMCYGDYNVLIENMDKLQPFPADGKKTAGVNIRSQFNKSEVVKIGKQFSSKVCMDIIKMFALGESLK